MAIRGVKKKSHEKLDNANIAKVIDLLSQDSPITKKQACEILNISYNTTRLGKIIDGYNADQEYRRNRMKQNRNKPIQAYEAKEIIVSFLSGIAISTIASRMYRSVSSVKKFIESEPLPERVKTHHAGESNVIPDNMVSDSFELKELVWSSQYNCVAEIVKELDKHPTADCNIYSIWVHGKYSQYAMQPAFELGKLDVLKKYDLKTSELTETSSSVTDLRIKD